MEAKHKRINHTANSALKYQTNHPKNNIGSKHSE